MKLGSRVGFGRNRKSPLIRKSVGTVIALGNGVVEVRWDSGPIIKHDADVLVEIDLEPFPFHSHRTMAQVIQDEQKPEPA